MVDEPVRVEGGAVRGCPARSGRRGPGAGRGRERGRRQLQAGRGAQKGARRAPGLHLRQEQERRRVQRVQRGAAPQDTQRLRRAVRPPARSIQTELCLATGVRIADETLLTQTADWN